MAPRGCVAQEPGSAGGSAIGLIVRRHREIRSSLKVEMQPSVTVQIQRTSTRWILRLQKAGTDNQVQGPIPYSLSRRPSQAPSAKRAHPWVAASNTKPSAAENNAVIIVIYSPYHSSRDQSTGDRPVDQSPSTMILQQALSRGPQRSECSEREPGLSGCSLLSFEFSVTERSAKAPVSARGRVLAVGSAKGTALATGLAQGSGLEQEQAWAQGSVQG